MKIICKRGEKDYYDYLQNYYGIDELVVYDRRKTFNIDPSSFYIGHGLDDIFKKVKNPMYDTKRRLVKSYFNKSAVMEGRFLYFVVEIGYYHYYFKVERYLDDNDNVILEPTLTKKEKIDRNKRLSNAPLSILARCSWSRWNDSMNLSKWYNEDIIENPILKDTFIPRFIDPKEVWDNLYEYISSLRDKEFVDSRTNDEHIESNGFDKKISFRHRK